MPRKKTFLPSLFFLLSIFLGNYLNLFAQYRFDVWTTDNGLPQNGVRQLAQTPDGYLWFTTFDGIVKFDGVKFTTFNKGNTKGIINNRFTGLYCDKDGTLYATTMEDGILTIFKNGVFTSFSSDQVPGNYIQEIRPDENGELRFFVEDEGRKSKSWYYLRDGQFVFNEKKEKETYSLDYRGQTGSVWNVTRSKTTELRNGNLTTYFHEAGLYDYSNEVFEDSKGGLWIGGRILLYLKNGEVTVFGEPEGFPKNSDFHSIREESDGSIWFANGGRTNIGVGIVRFKDGFFSFFGKESGLSGLNVFDVLKDREGNVWVATNKGLNRMKREVIETLGTKEGLINPEVYPIYRDSKDNIWVGTIKGLSIYKNGKFENVKLKENTPKKFERTKWESEKISVQSFMEDSNGKIWIGASGGLSVAQNGEAERLEAAEGHHVHAILQDKSGDIWAATNRGILRFRNYENIGFYSLNEGLPNEFMTTIFQDSRGRLWFGGFGGLSEFKDGKFINYTKNDGLVGNYLRTIYEDAEGVLWIGTYDEGLSRFKDGEFANFTAENGLYNNGVFAIQEDKKGNFWISSNRGIYRVSRRELNDFADKKIAKINSIGYGKEDGMLSTECNGGRQPSSLKTSDGKFWFPTQDGIVVVNPELESYNSIPPPVVIESVTVEREEVSFKDGIIIQPYQRNIEISYTGLSLIKSNQLKFTYKLEGHDENWIDADTRRTAYYSYLPPGNYTFRVKAANSDGIWNEEGATINIELKPFFYQTNLFILFCILAFAIGLLIVWKVSVYQLKLRERKLKKLVAERTRELDEANKELQQLANSDGLTNIGNRRKFEEFLNNEWNRTIRSKTEISLIMIDVDYFKLYNDHYGHKAGDKCLKLIAQTLSEIVNRPSDLVARFGGEEFAIILGSTDSEGAIQIAERAINSVKELEIEHKKSKISNYVTISVGVATTFAILGMTESDLIEAADNALYKAKENGRNQLQALDSLTQNLTNLDEEFVDVN